MIREIVPPATGTAFDAMRALRSQLVDRAAFVRQVDEVQRPAGYRLVGVFEPPSAPEAAAVVAVAVAVAGFRLLDNLHVGRFLYVDDLSTAPDARRRGHGRRLLDWLAEEARRLDCRQLQLDSGVGLHRADAHRLYLNAGFVISSHHFAKLL